MGGEVPVHLNDELKTKGFIEFRGTVPLQLPRKKKKRWTNLYNTSERTNTTHTPPTSKK